jgi:hypothetical protein
MIAPDYRVIAIDETSNWDEKIVAITGRIAGVYVVNFAEVTHLCSLTGSYYGQFLRNISEHYVRAPDGYNAGVALWEVDSDDCEGTTRGKALLAACGKDWDEVIYDNGGEDGAYFEERSLDPAQGSPVDLSGTEWAEEPADLNEAQAETWRQQRDEAAYEVARYLECNGEEWEDIAPWRKPVAVSHFVEGMTRQYILTRVNTIKEAEDWIAEREQIDPEGVHRGDYGIDAPEEMINP